MNKKLILLLLAFALLLGGAYFLYNNLIQDYTADQQGEYIPQPAPDCTVYDADGNAVSLSDFVGKPVVLNFWTSWCGPCQMEMPHFQAKFAELGDQVQFMMVNVTGDSRETEADAKQFYADSGYTFPVFYDLDSSARLTYSIYSYPTTYFIDAQGNLVAGAQGMIDADILQTGIDMIR